MQCVKKLTKENKKNNVTPNYCQAKIPVITLEELQYWHPQRYDLNKFESK